MAKSTNHYQRFSLGILFLIFSFLIVCPCLADVANPLADTDWVMQVKAKAKGKIIGSQKMDDIGYLSFAADGTWFLMDSEGYGLGETYYFDDKGKLHMDIGAETIEDFFYDYFMDMMPYGLEQYLDDISVLSSKSKSSFKQKIDCMDLQYSLSFKIRMIMHDQEGKVHKITVSYSVTASGNKCQQVGAIWEIEADCNYKLKNTTVPL